MPSSFLPWILPPARQHPRIFFKIADRPTLLSRIAGSHKIYWDDLQGFCSGSIGNTHSYFASRNGEHVGAHAFSWYLSGNTRHGDKAISEALYIASQNIAAGHIKRQNLLAMVMAYDWTYARMTSAQQGTIRSRISDYVEAMYRLQPNEHLWGISHGNMNYATVAVAAILQDGTSSENSRWSSRMDSIMNSYDNGTSVGLFPIWKHYGSSDGGTHKGSASTGYYALYEHFYTLAFPALDTAVGWNWYNEGQTWWKQGPYWPLWHLRMSSTGRSSIFRENEAQAQSHLDRYTELHCIQVAAKDGATTLGRHATWLADLIESTDDTRLEDAYALHPIIFRDASISALEPTIANTGGKQLKVFSKVAKCVWRSSWSQNSVALAVPAPKHYTGGHEQRRAGELQICGYGERLLIRNGVYDTDGDEVPKIPGDPVNTGHRRTYYGRICATCCVAIMDSEEKTENARDSTRVRLPESTTFGVKFGSTIQFSNVGDQLWPKNSGFTLYQPTDLANMLAEPKWNFPGLAATPIENSQLAYAVFNLKPYYYSGKCSKYRRHVLWVKSGVVGAWPHGPIVMVWDDMNTVVDSAHGRKTQRYLLNATVKPTGSASSLVFAVGGAKLFHRVLKPNVSVDFVQGYQDFDGVTYPASTGDADADSNSGQWRTEITPASATTTPSFLTFHFVGPSTESSPPSLVLIDDGTWIGAFVGGVAVKIRVGDSFEASIDGGGSGILTSTGSSTTASSTTSKSTTRESTTTIFVTQAPIASFAPAGFPQMNPALDKPASRLYLGGVDANCPVLSGLGASMKLLLNRGEELQRWRIYSDEGFEKELIWEHLEAPDDGPLDFSIPVTSIIFGTDTDKSPTGRRNFVEWTTSYGKQTRQVWVKTLPSIGSLYVNNQEAQSAGAGFNLKAGNPFTFSLNILPNFVDEFFRQHAYGENRWTNTLRSWGGAFTAEVFLRNSLIINERPLTDVHGYYWHTPVEGASQIRVRLRASKGSPYFVNVLGTITVEIA